jgi:hypothetical protein
LQVASLGGSRSAGDVDAAKAAGLADITVRVLLCNNSVDSHAAGSVWLVDSNDSNQGTMGSN